MQDEVVTVPSQRFQEHYLPFVPSDSAVQDCLKVLKDKRLVIEDANNKNLWEACQAPPSQSGVIESSAYNFLSETADVLVNAEYKVKNAAKEVNDNRRKVLSAAIHVMDDDVRRTHMYSITIEDDQFMPWYWSRSHSARSEPVNFVNDVETILKILISLLFASEQELGLDSTVQRCFDEKRNNTCFVYKIGKKYFKTVQSIIENRALVMTTRATRVFRVVEVKDFNDLSELGPEKVLKDVWLESKADTEKGIQTKLFARFDALADRLSGAGPEPIQLQAMKNEDVKTTLIDAITTKKYKNYFLTIEWDSEGTSCKAVADDAKRSPFCEEERASVRPARVVYADLSRSYGSPHPINTSSPTPNISTERAFATKRPYRVVYNEVCEPLHHVASLATVLKAMIDCLRGMRLLHLVSPLLSPGIPAVQLMYCVGWIHRDVSSGNLLWYGAGERGILSDLEYAKEFNPQGSGQPDPKTGTVYFMAIEIASQLHLFLPERGFGKKAHPLRTHHVIHNFQHDLESFFWLLMWTLLGRIEGTRVSRWLVKTVFMENDLTVRRKVLADMDYLGKMLSKGLPDCVASYQEDLEWFSGALFTGYMLRKSKIEDIASYAEPHCIASAVLAECHEYAVNHDIVLKVYGKHMVQAPSEDLGARQTRGTRKRSRDDDVYEPDQESGGSGDGSEGPSSKSPRGESTTDIGSERQLRPRARTE
ncbi:hypothetical protein OE88DRAFT_1740027 [Heliocybe sulcata]|uniref:Fungal-type protein kinase domain-containing protein n=1 Tax=Heliocybe sulcata TaxID=5364 RepID=A0A5C3MK22_9AGAM|nr:hypothetical protein OE88DRAFT_1740027 [Heliocybe sulcata]